MNKLSIQDRVAILNALSLSLSLSEGMGVNAASRVTGKSKNKNTILKLLADVGEGIRPQAGRLLFLVGMSKKSSNGFMGDIPRGFGAP